MVQTSDSTLNYNGKDAFITKECADAYFGEIDVVPYPGIPTFRSTYDHTIETYVPCMYMMERGIKVDREKLTEESKNVANRMEELGEEINVRCGQDINPNSPKDLQTYFYIKLGITPYTKLNTQKKSVITCDDKALQRLARGTATRKGLPEARLIQEWKGLSKLRGTYLEITFDTDNRLRCSYNPRGTRFGRLSSSKTIFDTGMNMQNLDPRFLGFLVADEDCLFIDIDKAGAEWVVMAYITGDDAMISVIEQGLDPHVATAAKMFGFSPEQIEEEDKLLGHHSDPILIKAERMLVPWLREAIENGVWLPRNMSMRQCAKKSNHGLNYDEGYRTFGLINEITDKEAKTIINFYHDTYPGIRKYFDTTVNKLQDNGRILTNLYGRPQRFLGKFESDLFKAAYSFVPQSTVGELVNRGMCDIYYSKAKQLDKVEIMRQVHDSITVQVPLNGEYLGSNIIEMVRLLNPTLKAGAREFEIGTDIKIGFDLKNMIEVPIASDPVTQTTLIRIATDGLERSW